MNIHTTGNNDHDVSTDNVNDSEDGEGMIMM